MELIYLDFDTSEDADGAVVFDAMASVAADKRALLWAEVSAVLDWAWQTFPGAQAPLEDGGEWDYLLEGAQEVRIPQVLHYDRHAGGISAESGAPGPARHMVTLSITGTAGFGEAFREAFGLV